GRTRGWWRRAGRSARCCSTAWACAAGGRCRHWRPRWWMRTQCGCCGSGRGRSSQDQRRRILPGRSRAWDSRDEMKPGGRHMSWRYLFFGAALPMAACTRPAVPQPAREDAECAAAFIDLIEKDQGYRLGDGPDIEKELAAAKLELPKLLRGCIELLRHGSSSDDKVKSARFLGRPGNP